MALNIELFYIISRKLSLCGLFWTTLYIYTKPRQQNFRAMNGAHLASPIRGSLVMLIGPSWEPNLLPYWAPYLGPIRETRRLP